MAVTVLNAIKIGSTPQTAQIFALTESVADTSIVLDVQGVEQYSVQSSYTDATPTLKTFAASDVDVTANTITITAHGFVTGLKIPLTGTNLPGGLSATDYWAIVVDANTIKVADTLAHAVAGTPVDITTQGTSVDATFTPTALGSSTFAAFASNDGVNYVALTSQTVTISAAGSTLFRLGSPDYRFCKLLFTAPTAGALTISAYVNSRKLWAQNA